VLYLDSSAIVKLVVHEPETADLVQAVLADPEIVSSGLAWTEVMIAARRAGRSTARAERVLDGIAFIPIDDGILREAAALGPKDLRTLDAIHVATALSLRPDVVTMITYDVRQALVASALGLVVAKPGSTLPMRPSSPS
jgi:predicted nucleic acid-binding protein